MTTTTGIFCDVPTCTSANAEYICDRCGDNLCGEHAYKGHRFEGETICPACQWSDPNEG